MKNFVISILLLLFFGKTNAQKLHLIMVSDYAQPTFGIVSQADEVTVNKIFETVASGIKYQPIVSNLNSNNGRFSKVEVLKNFETLKTNPEDIIVFFYSGEGLFSSKSDFPIFKLTDYENNSLSVDDIANMLKTKGVRLGIVIAECRNAESNVQKGDNLSRGILPTEDFKNLIIPKLFLEPCGIYKISSISRGNTGWKMPYTTNSAFIYSLNDELTKLLNISESEAIGSLSLENLMKKTKTNVDESLKDFVSNEKVQTVQWNFTPFDVKKTSSFKQYPASNFVIYSSKFLKDQLELLTNTTGPARNTVITTVSDMFQKKAVLDITVENPTNIGNPAKLQLSIEQYIDLTSKYSSNFHRTINFKVGDFKRTDDLKKISYLRFREKTL